MNFDYLKKDWAIDCFYCMSNTPSFSLIFPLNNFRGSMLLLICTQAKLFITKGMVFNITFTEILHAWGCFCQSYGVFFFAGHL